MESVGSVKDETYEHKDPLKWRQLVQWHTEPLRGSADAGTGMSNVQVWHKQRALSITWSLDMIVC